MVMAIGLALDSASENAAFKDIQAVVNACSVPVKVIIETAYLDEAHIRKATQWCVDAGATFVKTSTGFASRGASVEDIKTIKQELSRLGAADQVQIKASGGIRNAKDFQTYVDLGVHRIGSSNSVAILSELAGASPTSSSPGAY
jgi:deoxyribose-phosphate aldolase